MLIKHIQSKMAAKRATDATQPDIAGAYIEFFIS